ncbi:hypothetical protein PVAP13_6NG058300 [Panicum virgatum]|uniref:Uncharacterized protein n=1 Tax=Panicum virgatum TaxID=38727 RepID=A0A8T0QUA0_PANVG|nr:hypothetical protein PVAP13_6NG058300 [Panicum virgatum]
MRGQDVRSQPQDHLHQRLLGPQAPPGHGRPPPCGRGLRGLVGQAGVGRHGVRPPPLPLPAAPLQVLQEAPPARHGPPVNLLLLPSPVHCFTLVLEVERFQVFALLPKTFSVCFNSSRINWFLMLAYVLHRPSLLYLCACYYTACVSSCLSVSLEADDVSLSGILVWFAWLCVWPCA